MKRRSNHSNLNIEIPEAPGSSNLVVRCTDGAFLEKAKALSDHLGIPFLPETDDSQPDQLSLIYDQDGLSLTKGELKMTGDFTHLIPRLTHANLSHELLVKAAKFKNADHPLTAIDATAGMGEDSLLLAASGFHVTLYEYNPVIAALLRDTLERSEIISELAETVARMNLIEGDSCTALQNIKEAPDLVLLDPMFPERQKSALIRKKFQLLHHLERPCENEEILFAAALKAGPKKIVVKRPCKGPFLAQKKPDYSLTGKAVRYDCYLHLNLEAPS